MRAKRRVTLGILIAGLAFANAAPARSQNVSDETGPTISNVTFSTTSVDTSSGPQNVTVTVTGTDDLSGINYILLYLRTIATSQPANQTSVNCFVSALTSGTRLDGTYTGTCSFPQYSQSGAWFVYQTYAYDMVGNYKTDYNNGAQLSIASQIISVTAPSPTPATSTIPSLLSLTLNPAAVDTSDSPQSVTLTARITSLNGSFSYGRAGLRDPSSTQYVDVYFYSSNRISGDAFDGTYQVTAALPRYSRGGTWIWSYAQLSNSSNHYSYYYNAVNGAFNHLQTYNGATSSFTHLGTSGPSLTPESLTVHSNPSDTAAPTLVNFEINPPSIDVSTSSKTITVTIAVADDLSGFSFGCFGFVSPNGQQSRSGCFSLLSSTVAMFFPQYSQAGNWFLNYFYLYDRIGNYRYLYANDVSQLGFPTSIQISSGVSVQNATGYVDGMVSLSAKLTKLGVPAANKTLAFTLRGASVGSAVTDINGVATLQDVSLAGIQVGTYVNAIVATFAGDAEQAAASGQATLLVTNKLSQTISFADLSDRALTNTPFTVAATASSGLTVTFAATGVCSVNGTSVTLTAAGSCTIIASQGGNGLFNAAPSVSRTFNVASKSDQTITFPAIADRRYGDASFALAPESSSGLPVTLQAGGNCSITGSTVTIGAVGTCQVTASQEGNDAYNAAPNVVRSFAITRAALTVTADANPGTSSIDRFMKTYNGQVYTGFVVRYDGFVNGETSGVLNGTLSFSGQATTAATAGGPYNVTPGGLTSANYALTFVNGALEIGSTPLTIAATDAYALLNGTIPPLGAVYSGFVAGENSSVLGGTLNCATTAGANGAVGSYAINCSGQTSSNYSISYKAGTLYVQYAAATAACYGDAGHSILQPIDVDGSSVFKKGSTVPAKFRVCDANGVPIGTAGVVASFRLTQVLNGTVGDVDESVASTTPDETFRWDASAQQWIFNINTKPLSASRTYIYAITLNDGTSVTFRYGLR